MKIFSLLIAVLLVFSIPLHAGTGLTVDSGIKVSVGNNTILRLDGGTVNFAAGSTLESGQNSIIELPDGTHNISAVVDMIGADGQYSVIKPSGTSYSIIFAEPFNAEYLKFEGLGDGSITFQGDDTILANTIFSGGTGTNNYVNYNNSGTHIWTDLSFGYSATKKTIHTLASSGDIYVYGYASETGVWMGGDSTDFEEGGEVHWDEYLVLTFNAGTGGSITGTTPQNIQYGSDATAVTAVPDTGSFFTGWSGDYLGKDNPLTITNVTKDMNITANFATTAQVELTTGVNPIAAGTVTPEGTTSVKSGTASNITATPSAGYTFAGWTIVGNGTIADISAASTTVTLTEKSIVTANFSIDGVTVDLIMAVNDAAGGVITPDVGTTSVNQGAMQAITATANAGWSFVGWQVAGSASIADPYSDSTTATITGNATITAVFLEDAEVATLTMASEPGGNTSPSDSVIVQQNTAFPIQAIPQKGFVFTGWTSSGSATIDNVFSADTTVTLTGDATVTAGFTEGDTDNCIIMIKTSNKKTDKDMVNARKIPMTFTTFDPANGATVYVDGKKYEMTEANGEFKERSSGYMYTSTDKTVKLYIDTTKQNWSFRCIKQNLTDIDNANGIDIILKVGANNYGGNFMFDEKNKWNYKEGKTGNSTSTVDLSGTTFDITISMAQGSYDNAKDDKDKINIKKAILPTTLTFVPTADKVIMAIDDVTVVIPPKSFTEKKTGCYDYKDKETGIKMKMDTNKGNWTFMLPKVSVWGKTSPHNGVVIILSIGDSQAGVQLNPLHQTMFKYKGEKTQ